MNTADRPRRSLLYVPGDHPEMLAKAGTRGADGVILNLEDAVAPGKKLQAREAVANALLSTDFGSAERVVRINSLDTDLGFSDLLALVPLAPDAVLLSKVSSAEQVRCAGWVIERLESIHALRPNRIRIMCMIETGAGVLAAGEIAKAHRRVSSLLFGAADFCAEINCEPTADQRSLLYATSRLVLSAHSAGITAIDAPHMKLEDQRGLEQSCLISRELGFDGKSAIHPAQVPTINAAFSPSAEQIRWANSVLEALSGIAGPEAMEGAALLDGHLIEAPHMLRARRIVETAKRLGIAAA